MVNSGEGCEEFNHSNYRDLPFLAIVVSISLQMLLRTLSGLHPLICKEAVVSVIQKQNMRLTPANHNLPKTLHIKLEFETAR